MRNKEISKQVYEILEIKNEIINSQQKLTDLQAKQIELALKALEETERLRKRTVPDMSELSHNDHFQLKALYEQCGSGYLINVIRHFDHLANIPDYFSPERTSPNGLGGTENDNARKG